MYPSSDDISPLSQFNDWLTKAWGVPKQYNWLLTASNECVTRQPKEFLDLFEEYFLEVHHIQLQVPIIPPCGYSKKSSGQDEQKTGT